MWALIKFIAHTTEQNSSATELVSISDPKSAIINVNRFFANIGKSLTETVLISGLMSHCIAVTKRIPPVSSFVLLLTDKMEIESLIGKFRDERAAGYDGIVSALIKRYKLILTTPITFICTLTGICTGVYRNAFKKAQILPIHKIGTKGCVNTYRPISLLPALSKTLKRILNCRLKNYLEKHILLSAAQYGFRSKVSIQTRRHDLTDFIIKNIGENKKVLGPFLELAKAFETVSVPLLISKLEGVGVRDL